MNTAYNTNGAQVDSVKEYDIATGTAVAVGQVVKLTSGLVVLATAGETNAILGIAMEAHSGAADALNTRSNGTRSCSMPIPASSDISIEEKKYLSSSKIL